MKKTFFLFRYISWVAVICSLFGSLLLFIVGALKTYNAFSVVLFNHIPEDKAHLHTVDIATTYLIKSLDTFLIALVLFIFAHGVYSLFISNKKYDDGSGVLNWIKTPNIGHLKYVLAEVIFILLLALGLKFSSLNKEGIDLNKK